MQPSRRSLHETELHKKLLAVVERCSFLESKDRVANCIEVFDLVDSMATISEEAYELLLHELGVRVIPPMKINRISELAGQVASRFSELSAEDKADKNWAEVAAVTLVTKLWTIGEALAIEHAKSRATQFKAVPQGLLSLYRTIKRSTIRSVWTAEPGACEICAFLNGSEIENLFDDGPPAHPNCRCHVEHYITEDDSDS